MVVEARIALPLLVAFFFATALRAALMLPYEQARRVVAWIVVLQLILGTLVLLHILVGPGST